jgi:hypothetical protein
MQRRTLIAAAVFLAALSSDLLAQEDDSELLEDGLTPAPHTSNPKNPVPPPRAPAVPGSPKKKKEAGDGASGANPAGDAGKTAKSRARRLTRLFADAASDGRAEFLAAAETESIVAAAAAAPHDVAAAAKKSLADAQQLLAFGRWTDAFAAAKAAFAADRRLTAARLAAARALEGQGRASDAISEHLDPVLAAAPGDVAALHVRALVSWGTGNLDAARKDLVRALAARPGDGRLLLSLGVLDAERREFADAASSLFLATDERPTDTSAWRALARAFWFGGDWPGAVAAEERIVRIVEGPPRAAGGPAPGRPGSLDAHLALAVLYADKIGDRDKARAHASSFLAGGGIDLPLDEWLRGLTTK